MSYGSFAFAALAASALGGGWADGMGYGGRGYYESAPERKPVKCRLPRCEETTTHNGGYCCAEHCREHNPKRRRAGA